WSAVSWVAKLPITCPPRNPTSTRTRVTLATRHHLRENAVDGIRMHEGDLQTEHAPPRLRVDQLGTVADEVAEGDADVLHLVRDVVHARAATGEEPAHRRVVRERRAQLDRAPAGLPAPRPRAPLADPGPAREP